MPNIQVRNLGQYGAVPDASPWDLPVNAFDVAINARFDENKLKRSLAFKSLGTTTTADVGRFIIGGTASSGFDSIIIASSDYDLYLYSPANNTYTQKLTGGGSYTSNEQYTGIVFDGGFYITRPDRVPQYLSLGSGGNFGDLANWDANERCRVLRSFNSFLIALNITKQSSSHPTMVKWSDLKVDGSNPGWDETNTNLLAAENTIADMPSEIVDGRQLRNAFFIYSRDQVYRMDFIGGNSIFSFKKVFDKSGLINTNCVVEAENQHYCFGLDDLYVHDGVQKKSIADERVRNFIFNGINTSDNAGEVSKAFFVTYNAVAKEVLFCYTSGDAFVPSDLSATARCNRAAVYNIMNNTWAFIDLPNVSSATAASLNLAVATYDNQTQTYNNAGFTYASQDAQDFVRRSIFVTEAHGSGVHNVKEVCVLDNLDSGSIAKPATSRVLNASFARRLQIDLDEQGTPLSGYKNIRNIYPQATITTGALTFNLSASDRPTDEFSTNLTKTFTPSTDYKIDTRLAGRYLNYEVRETNGKDYSLSGFDMDIITTGRR